MTSCECCPDSFPEPVAIRPIENASVANIIAIMTAQSLDGNPEIIYGSVSEQQPQPN